MEFVAIMLGAWAAMVCLIAVVAAVVALGSAVEYRGEPVFAEGVGVGVVAVVVA